MEGNGVIRDEEEARVVTTSVPHGKPYAGKLHVRFDEGAGEPDEGRYSTNESFDILLGVRKARVIENCRCYHLISRLAHQAFFLDDEEKTRAVELLRQARGDRR